jgi:chaperonin GroES
MHSTSVSRHGCTVCVFRNAIYDFAIASYFLEFLKTRPYNWHSLHASANKIPHGVLPGGFTQRSSVSISIQRGVCMNLRPLHDRVIVKRLDQETKTASGIVIPDAAAEKPDQGEVVAIGAGKRNDKGDLIALDVKVGDRVLFGKYAGQTVKVDGNELLVMREEDIMAIVQK